jgi:hypothetical protein
LRSADGPPVSPRRQRARAIPALQRVAFALVILVADWCVGSKPALSQNLQPDNQPNILSGTVVNAVTNQPIGRALVHSADDRYATLTDGGGHFEFTLPKQELYANGGSAYVGPVTVISLMVRKPGFLDERNGRGPVQALPGVEITIPLTPEALIKGRVTLSAADPVRGIEVELFFRQVLDGSFRWMRKNSSRTNSDGEFRFAELEPGTYKVLTREWMDNDPETRVPGGQLYGFPPVYYPSATDFALASAIQLTAGQTFQADLSLVRQPYYPVKIPVTNAEEKSGMNVTVTLQGQRGPGYSLGYNLAKQMIEGQLPNGKYLVEAEKYGPNSVSGSVNLVVAGAQAEGPTLVLARNNSIPVNVKEEFTNADRRSSGSWSDGGHTFTFHGPRSEIDIQPVAMDDFARNNGSIRPPTRQNDDSLVLENLAPGRYWLQFRAFQGYVASAAMGGMDLLREPLVVVPGVNASIDITMRDDAAELEGTLLGIPAIPRGPGFRGAQGFVYCIPLPDSSGQFMEVAVSYEGKFDYPRIAPGVYRVIAFDRQQRDIPYRDAEAMKAYETKGQIVHFAPGQKVSLQLQIVSGSD